MRTGEPEQLLPLDAFPVGLRLAIAAGLDAKRPLPNVASSRAIALRERQLVDGLVRTLSRGRIPRCLQPISSCA